MDVANVVCSSAKKSQDNQTHVQCRPHIIQRLGVYTKTNATSAIMYCIDVLLMYTTCTSTVSYYSTSFGQSDTPVCGSLTHNYTHTSMCIHTILHVCTKHTCNYKQYKE